MNLQAEIRPELWNAVSQKYESEDYTNAILAAFHYLRDLIRDTANIDGDGVALVGQALGGSNPRLRINKFETETQKDEQKGFEQILRGMYQGIRNPRTHDFMEDRKENADAIILFVNYAIGVISKAKGPFTIDEWIGRVIDPDFVGSERYARLLVEEVPPKKYIEALKAVYRNKTASEGDKLRLVVNVLIELSGEDKLDEFIDTVGQELRVASDEAVIRRALHLLPEHLWPRIDEAARLRIENKLIKSIQEGRAITSARRATHGALGTWARGFAKSFTLKNDLYQILLKKLKGNEEEQSYVVLYFWSVFPHTFEKPVSDYARNSWINAICEAVSDPSGSTIVREKLADGFHRFPDNWRLPILEKLKGLEEDDPDFYASLANATDESEIPF
jgi:uncharacterized protein (TIGR02391 family)